MLLGMGANEPGTPENPIVFPVTPDNIITLPVASGGWAPILKAGAYLLGAIMLFKLIRKA